MRTILFQRWLRYLLIVMFLSGCAGLQPQVAVAPGTGEKIIDIRAGSFKFEPNNIRAYKDDRLLLKIDNVSGSGHNFTLKDPAGRVLQNVDLPSGKTTEIVITLAEKGVYEFYCDKPFHSALGMKGRIEAADESVPHE